ncbi:MAG TPA: helix-turn-helix domain-containing protein [Candidatus Blautia faecavium]|uniref:Helix-turn-helix domain-containing protein n=1 Tax=Candidatus Blautia faecavium TaxID=2838487 RepID=A0A9D2RV18_9FIRM|nr:helix-turn-helix domain-containing protein [Candidatus Blautia faecavium]
MKYENIVQCQFSSKSRNAMHFHPDIEIIYVLDGALKVEFEAEKFHLNTDDFILVNSNVRHSWQALSEDVLLGSLFVDSVMLREIFGGELPLFLCNSSAEESDSYKKMRYYIRQIFNYYQTTEGQGILLKNSIYYQLLYLITTDFIVKKGMKQYDGLRGIHDERMNEILGYLMSNFNREISLSELAEHLYLSVPYLSKYIKKNFGMSFLKLLNNIRLEKAVSELLYTDKTVLKIAMECGFSNMAGFNHVFKESYHMNPTEYRLQAQDRIPKREEVINSREILEKVEQYLSDNLVEAPETDNPAYSSLEVDKNNRRPLKKNWCRLINIGSAPNLLRYDVRRQVTYLKENLSLEYVRFWNLLSEEMMINLEGPRISYNFALIDQILDFLVAIHVKPHIELNNKGDWFLKKVQREMLQNKYHSRIHLLENNMVFLEEFIRHLVRRYGPKEVGSWYFELEKNSVMQHEVSTGQYLRVFAGISRLFKTYAPDVKVGGAGFTVNMMGKQFSDILKAWKKNGVLPDFLSIYSYPYLLDEELLDAGRNPYSPDEHYLSRQIAFVRATMEEVGFSVPEFMVTEWSFTLSNRNRLNDGCFKSAYIMKTIMENYDSADAMGYWLATDIYSENIDSSTLLFGGCGLLTRHGIRKPAYFSYETLNRTEPYFLGKNSNALVSHNGRQLYFICCHNYKHFNFRYYSKEESEIELGNQQRLFTDQESLRMTIKINNANNGRYVVKTYSVGPGTGNIQDEWKRLGYFEDLSEEDIQRIGAGCQPELTIGYTEVKEHVLELELHIAAQEIQGIVISEV